MAQELIPFGKYKGQPVDQLQQDPEYAKWLLQQPWFVGRYSNIQTLIVNNFKEAAETPEHNALQARFLDRQFAFSVACKAREWQPFQQWADSKLATFLNTYKNALQEGFYKIEFEVDGWDVVVEAEYGAWNEPFSYSTTRHSVRWGGKFYCELKPTMGEDFPSVLRQVKSRRGGGYVLIEQFTATSVTFEQACEIFAMSRIRLIRCSDIPIVEAPDWVNRKSG